MTKDQKRKLFVAHLRYWKEKLNLGNYRVSSTDDYEGIGGECRMKHDDLNVVIAIGETDDIYTVPVIARHEMLELLLEPMYAVCASEVHEDKVYRAGHEVIHRLEQVLPIPTDKEVGYKKVKKAKK